MRRLVSTLALLCCLSSVFWTGATAHADTLDVARLSTGSGAITGSLVNGAHHDAPVAGASVTLQSAASQGQPKDLSSATTDAHGHFSFAGLDTSGATSYDVYTTFQNGTFTSDTVSFANGAAQQVTLRVYDTTSSDAALHVSLATILFSPPNNQEGFIPVGEYITFDNTGPTAVVASQAPANGMPMGLLRFALPAGATNLTLGAGFTASQQIAQVSTGFGASATVPPGQSQFAFAFDIPYTSTAYAFSYKAEYTTDQIAVLMPMGIAVDAGDFTTEPPVTANGAHYQLFTRGAVERNQTSALNLSALPAPGERPFLSFRALVGLGVVLALLLALLLALYLRRGELAVVFGLIPATEARSRTRQRPSAHGRSVIFDQTERKRLLRELLSLEASHDAGKLNDESYLRRSTETRGRLREIMASEESTIPVGAARSTPVAAGSTQVTEAGGAVVATTTPEADQPTMRTDRAMTGGKR